MSHNVPLFFLVLNKLEFKDTFYSNLLICKFQENPSDEGGVLSCVQTNRNDEAKSRFS
jgi:hypothetical protein